MILRMLRAEDAPYMLEWMHDESVVRNLKADFENKTLVDCEKFIVASWNDPKSIHLAIDEAGEYMGTVSFKNIQENKAEFAIAVRKKAMGTGISAWAMKQMILKGFKEYKLNTIYWYVSVQNIRAIKFYDKNGYKRSMNNQGLEDADNDYIWYEISRNAGKFDVIQNNG